MVIHACLGELDGFSEFKDLFKYRAKNIEVSGKDTVFIFMYLKTLYRSFLLVKKNERENCPSKNLTHCMLPQRGSLHQKMGLRTVWCLGK